MEYKKSRQNAKRVISSAKEKKQKECPSDLNDSECQNEIFLLLCVLFLYIWVYITYCILVFCIFLPGCV